MDRLSKLDGLKNFITEKKLFLDSLLEEFDWKRENVMKEFNNDSDKTKSDVEEPLFPESLEWNNSCVIDDQILHNILKEKCNDENSSKILSSTTVPKKFSDLQVNFSREQKLAIYEYVINNTKKLSEPELTISIKSEDNGDKKMMTFAEIVAIKRNLKRRRQKYRTTKIPPLSQTEEIRNLIDLQMQAFIQYKNEKNSISSNENKDNINDNKERKDEREKSELKIEAHCSSRTKARNHRYRNRSVSSGDRSSSRRNENHRKSSKDKRKSKDSKKKKTKRHKSRDHHRHKNDDDDDYSRSRKKKKSTK